MGTWGVDSFDNDDAGDFVAALEADKSEPPVVNAERVIAALDAVFAQSAQGLDAGVAAIGVAAADIVATSLGQSRATEKADPYELENALKFNDDAVGKAVAVLSRVRADGSELAALWDETDDAEDWRTALSALEARLRKAAETHGLDPTFVPEDEGGMSEEQTIRDTVDQVYDDMMVEMERVADTGAGDPQVEMLRHLVRKMHLVHKDITNMRYFVVDSLDTLTARIDRIEKAGQ
ncbi:DUF4259 domain-containing protein [Jannaschia pohangensis]|uniref:DUF4259 domain-containing protein n=1 Tax=Jannaschia pohangensis TaxID=390807 RepID=A0A1I3Q2S5_9RHOB|nr:DUF4259 domain-containing protein [Jannaschia pohangensis]SFJ28138.1 protein of unknown function [Jannaschia pohangensis]